MIACMVCRVKDIEIFKEVLLEDDNIIDWCHTKQNPISAQKIANAATNMLNDNGCETVPRAYSGTLLSVASSIAAATSSPAAASSSAAAPPKTTSPSVEENAASSSDVTASSSDVTASPCSPVTKWVISFYLAI